MAQLQLSSTGIQPRDIRLRFNPGLPRIFGPRYDWRCPGCGRKCWSEADGIEPTADEVQRILNAPECEQNGYLECDGEEE